MNTTRIAVLGTLSHLHQQPIRYDLAELARIVADIQPDLLGVEAEREEFERGDLEHSPIEVRDTLVPLARKSDMVVVPVGAPSPEELRPAHPGIRAALIRLLDATLQRVQTTANDARRVNSPLVSHACGLICHLEEYTCGERGRQAWNIANSRILTNIVEIARRDPGTRILVAVQCRRKHWLEPKLRKTPAIELVSYWEL
jgi:hypothetical protein